MTSSHPRKPRTLARAALACGALLANGPLLSAEEVPVPFDEKHWDLGGAKVVEWLGRPALAGTALLKDAELENGVIEFDVAVTGARAYPGVVFRSKPDGSWERVYLRPHRSGRVPPSLYGDVVQYVPSFNRVDSWQLYNGDGFTAGAVVPLDRWFHVRLEVSGTQARVFLDGAPQPALRIHDLKHGRRRGGLGLMAGGVGTAEGASYFSSFSFRADDTLRFDPPPRRDPAPGIVRDWQVSRPFRALAVDLERPPGEQGLTDLGWRDVAPEPGGLVDVARLHPRSGEPDLVYARTVFRSDRPRTLRLQIGYSDAVSVFLDGRPCFSASSGYGTRDSSFLGVVGLNDTLHLPLRAGDNELMLAVAEVGGGWGFMARDADAVFASPGLEKAWETPREMKFPESAAWDPVSRAIYVSGYDAFNRSQGEGRQVLSRVSPQGRVEKVDWVTGLRNPTGLAVSGGRLLAVEPTSVAEIDIARARIVRRHDVPGAAMLNDIAVDGDGVAYVSDSVNGILYRLSGGKAEEWLRGPEVDRPNGVTLLGRRLVWGNNGDGRLKAADLATKATSVLADLGGGVIDGVEPAGDGALLVSHNEGRLYLVSPSGEVRRLLDTTGPEQGLADFEYVPELDLVVCPGWVRGNVVAYRLPSTSGSN